MPTIKVGDLVIECATAMEAAEILRHYTHTDSQVLPQKTAGNRKAKPGTPRARALVVLEELVALGGASIRSKDLAKKLGYTNGRVLSPILMAIRDVFDSIEGGQDAVVRLKKQRIGSLWSAGPRIGEAIAKLQKEAA